MTDTAHCPLRLFDERAAERGPGRGGGGEEGSKEVGEAKTKQGGGRGSGLRREEKRNMTEMEWKGGDKWKSWKEVVEEEAQEGV